MVGTASLAPRWSAPLRDYPGAPPHPFILQNCVHVGEYNIIYDSSQDLGVGEV